MKYVILLMLVLTTARLPAQLTNVEHFYASSPDAEKLFHLFKDTFQLTTVWNYQDWGNSASGGLMLGATPLEFIVFKNDKTTDTRFAGIALQPTLHINFLQRVYDSLHTSYGDIYVDTFTENSVKDTGYTLLQIKKALPDNIYFFTCDYKYRGEMDSLEKSAIDSLAAGNGGPLGIMYVKEIVVGCNDVKNFAGELSKLPGIERKENYLFSFSKGPSIRLVNNDSPGIQKIIVRVHSVIAAQNYLQRKNMLKIISGNIIMINPQSINGLQIEMTDEE